MLALLPTKSSIFTLKPSVMATSHHNDGVGSVGSVGSVGIAVGVIVLLFILAISKCMVRVVTMT